MDGEGKDEPGHTSLWLVICTGKHSGCGFQIHHGEQKLIGRHGDIRLVDDGYASRLHCTVENIGGVLRVVDLYSANGTYINGQLIEQGSLVPGDELLVGKTILVCRTMPAMTRAEGLDSPSRVQQILISCLNCGKTEYASWFTVESPSGGHDIFYVCDHCGYWGQLAAPP